jgi:hypothetical protein
MSIKNPDDEAQNPAPMPQTHKKMAPRSDSPPGIELDGEGNVIPFAQRTKEDQDKDRSR